MTSEPKIILHAGMHKTGSTYIQVRLSQHRNILRKLGYNYPALSTEGMPHHEVAWYFENSNNVTEDYRAIVRSWVEQPETLILSSEEFSRLDEAALEQLKSAFGDVSVAIVLYLRHWNDRLYSWWNQLIRYGESTSFPEYCSRLLQPLKHDDTDYCRVIARFASVFGRDAVRIVIFDNVVAAKEDLFTSFARYGLLLSDTSFIDLRQAAAKNESMADYEMEMLRLSNALNATRGIDPTEDFDTNASYQGAITAIFNQNLLEREGDEFRKLFDRHAKIFELPVSSYVFESLERRLSHKYHDLIANPGKDRLFDGRHRQKFRYVRLEDIVSDARDFTLIERINARIRELVRQYCEAIHR